MKTQFNAEVLDRLRQLEEKYAAGGQDMVSYLEGLLHAKYLTYWDYIEVDTLLTLQKPRTNFPDEVIFIVYHQITELYFLLIHREIDQVLALGERAPHHLPEWLKRMSRVLNYIRHLSASFDIMTYGMDQRQFLDFRMSLLPASGFQTASFREIELKTTGLHELLTLEQRGELLPGSAPELLYENIYWKRGNIELSTGRKTLTLRMFEERYDKEFLKLAASLHGHTLRHMRLAAPPDTRDNPELVDAYRKMDLMFNVFWRLSHYKAAARYLQRDPEVIKATGGTNWQQYLPPRFQRVIFFPELWTEQEKADWGKAWVQELFKESVEGHWSAALAQTQGDA